MVQDSSELITVLLMPGVKTIISPSKVGLLAGKSMLCGQQVAVHTHKHTGRGSSDSDHWDNLVGILGEDEEDKTVFVLAGHQAAETSGWDSVASQSQPVSSALRFSFRS